MVRTRSVVAVAIITLSGAHPGEVTACAYQESEILQPIEVMGVEPSVGMLILLSLLALLLIVALTKCRTIFQAARQTRDYESRVLTSLFYGRIEEVLSVSALFPSSPVAAVVLASLEQLRSLPFAPPDDLKPSKPAFHRSIVAHTIELKRWLWVLSAIGWSTPAIGLATALMPLSYGVGPPLSFYLSLLIAIPALWLYKGLSSEVDLLLCKTDRLSLSIIDEISDRIAATIDKPGAISHDSVREIRLQIPSRYSGPLRRHRSASHRL